MTNTREVAIAFASAIEERRFTDAFNMIAESGTYTVSGTTKASGLYNGRQDVLDRLVPVLSAFIEPPRVIFAHIVVDGDRAVLLGSGVGLGPTGPYDQPNYAFSLRIDDGQVVEIVEFLDTMMLHTALFGGAA